MNRPPNVRTVKPRTSSDWYIWSEDGEHLEAILDDDQLKQAKLTGTVIIQNGKHVLTSYGRQLIDEA